MWYIHTLEYYSAFKKEGNYLFKSLYLFLERVSMSGGGAEKRERESQAGSTLSVQSQTQAQTHEM